MKKTNFLKKLFQILGIFLILCLGIYFFRHPIMRGVGSVLICEDPLEQTEAMFVLSGNAEVRAKEAAKLLKSAYSNRIICTGEVVPDLYKEIGININEAQLSRSKLLLNGVVDSKITLLPKGTSTREESAAILAYCQQNGLKKIMVVSDKFHTNRIDFAFRKDYHNAGVELILRGAPAIEYQENLWWANEKGLLMVNNEYVKLVYYWLVY